MNVGTESHAGDELSQPMSILAFGVVSSIRPRNDPVVDAIRRMARNDRETNNRRRAAHLILRTIDNMRARAPLGSLPIGCDDVGYIRDLVEETPMLGQQMYVDTLSAIYDLLKAGYQLQPNREVMLRLESLADALMEL